MYTLYICIVCLCILPFIRYISLPKPTMSMLLDCVFHIPQEDVMSKTQQVKQYKKQIDQLNSELSVYKEQAAAHKTQV